MFPDYSVTYVPGLYPSDLWKLASLAFYLTRSQLSWGVRPLSGRFVPHREAQRA